MRHPAHSIRLPHIAVALCAAGAFIHARSAPASSAAKPDVEVAVEATAIHPIEHIGQTTFSRDEVQRQVPGTGDLNQLARTLNNVQFDAGAGLISEDDILDIRPSQLSISGGRTYENNFLIEGLSTTSVTDTTNTNIHAYDSVVGHPQTTFLSPALVDNLTIYESDVPAEFGGFTGGVVSADLRDPSGRWGGGVSADYSSSDLVHYLTDEADRSDPMPEQPTFHRESFDAYLDVPFSNQTTALFAWTRKTSVLENTQRHASYGVYSRKATTVDDTFLVKLLHHLGADTALRFTSIWSPYEQENSEQDLKLQNNDGWLNKLELTRTLDRGEFKAYAGFQWADNDREQEPYLYVYKNFGADDSIDWVADTSSSGSYGGNGDMNSRQQDIPIGAKFTYKLTDTGTLSLGADYTYTKARKQRPITNHAYRHKSSSSVVLDPTVVSAYGADDPTVIEGEQALDYRLTYVAFDARVELQTADAWVQWSDRGKLFNLPWSYRVGLRYDTDDFLKNNDLAPRLTGQIEPFSWLKLHAGYNRYYSHEMLAYKLRESYPDGYYYTRTYHLEDGRKVYYDDWTLYLHTKPANYSQAELNTPYSDETSLGLTFEFERYGRVYVHYLDRRSRDEFARSERSTSTYVNEVTGTTRTYSVYQVTNDGFTNYHSTSLEWEKTLRNHRLRVSATFSDTETSQAEDSEDYFAENSTAENLDELVYYDGALVSRRDVSLTRANYARPDYYNFVWSSSWLNRRLNIDLLGRWNTDYDYIENDGTITVDGSRYDLYENTHVPANLINDLNIQWTAWDTSRGALSLEVKVSNVFDRLPYARNATSSNPYQQGRTFWVRTSYTF